MKRADFAWENPQTNTPLSSLSLHTWTLQMKTNFNKSNIYHLFKNNSTYLINISAVYS